MLLFSEKYDAWIHYTIISSLLEISENPPFYIKNSENIRKISLFIEKYEKYSRGMLGPSTPLFPRVAT